MTDITPPVCGEIAHRIWRSPEGWYAGKCQRQAAELARLNAVLAATKDAELAKRCVEAEGRASRLAETVRRRESVYVKGYTAGYMAALRRHRIDEP